MMTVSIQERKTFLKQRTLFSGLSDTEFDELARALEEVSFSKGDVIVREGDLVDSVYIIVQGQAEVSKLKTHGKKNREEIVATIFENEPIGLNDTGFFSATGIRTATVKALNEMRLLKLTLPVFQNFLKKYPHVQTNMQGSLGKILRMQMIKQSLAFSRISPQRLEWLANKVEEISLPANAVIFKQGDIGDRCYLIRSGKVEIICEQPDGEVRQLAELRPHTLFGEATLITHEPRNATARTLENCELYVLKHEYLSELIESESNVASMFMTLMVDRSRPQKNPDVTEHHREAADGKSFIILKNAAKGSYFKLSEEGAFIWNQLDGQQTLQDITLALSDKFDVFAPEVVAALILKLTRDEFIVNVNVSDIQPKQETFWVRNLLRIQKLLEARVAIGDADRWLTRVYNKYVHYLFTRWGMLFLTILVVAGVVAFSIATPSVIQSFKTIPHSWTLLVLLIPVTIFSVALHELGHAFATKAFGHEVHYMGVGWYWLGPVAFTDTSDMWLSTRWRRTGVNIAGICTDIIDAGIFALLIFCTHDSYLQAFFWLFAVFTYINAFRMLSPLQELDGYYILMDLLDRPRLRQSAVTWLIKGFPKALRHPQLFLKNKAEICYWLSCIVFLTLTSLLTIFVQSFIFKMLGFTPAHPAVSLILPITVVILSSLSIIADIRSQAE